MTRRVEGRVEFHDGACIGPTARLLDGNTSSQQMVEAADGSPFVHRSSPLAARSGNCLRECDWDQNSRHPIPNFVHGVDVVEGSFVRARTQLRQIIHHTRLHGVRAAGNVVQRQQHDEPNKKQNGDREA